MNTTTDQETTRKPRRLISPAAVCDRLGVSSTTLWRMVRAGDFPRAVKISANRNGWPSDEIDDWIEARMQARMTGL